MNIAHLSALRPRRAASRGAPARVRVPLWAAACAALVAAACYEQPTVPDFESGGRLSVVNDEATLAQRVTYPEKPLPIDPPAPAPAAASAAAPAAAPARPPGSIDLRLVAEIDPPTVDGEVVQATSVWMTAHDDAIVSYNARGAAALGALDWFVRLLNKKPALRSSLHFSDSDVNAVMTDGRFAYAVTATSDPDVAAPAVLEKIYIRSDRFRVDDDNARVPLSSFAGTSTVGTGEVIYAVSGDDGGLFAFDVDDLTLLAQVPLDDARWVAWDEEEGRIVVLQGTPGRLAVFREGQFTGGTMTLLDTWSVPGVDVPESKSTVEVLGGKAFVAAGPEGVQIVCLDDGEIVGSVPRPDPASLGLSPSVVVTNSVTVDGDLMFVSNGEAGVYAAAADEPFADSGCDAQSIQVLGRLRFDDLQSANHVVYRRGNLFVAAGLGGIKVVDVALDD